MKRMGPKAQREKIRRANKAIQDRARVKRAELAKRRNEATVQNPAQLPDDACELPEMIDTVEQKED